MDDLTLLTELNRDEPLAGPAELRPARDRLLAAAAAERPPTGLANLASQPAGLANPSTRIANPSARIASSATSLASSADPRRLAAGTAGTTTAGSTTAATSRRRWRLTAAAGVTVSVAAGIAAVLVLGPTAPIGGKPPVAQADARGVLHAAAVAAVRQPDLHPRPNQFIYLRTVDAEAGQPARTRQVWLSVDGRRDGLVDDRGGDRFVLPGCPNGRQPDRDKQDRVIPEQSHECVATPAYRTDLPTTADAMLAWLRQNAGGKPGDINALGKGILDLAGAAYLPPRSLGALFEAASRLDGMQVIPDVADGAGRHGVGVAWLRDGTRMTLIFDRNTHAFLGTRYTYKESSNGPDLASGTALTRVAVVNRPGQQP
ncbi:MAG TPA: CU044_5270 family protein [Mycobacteriales bacterium]|nr:CU044_5270 family protein [Mycobacteriales bacterium]